VTIAELAGSRARVVGEGFCGSWSIWMRVSQLRQPGLRDDASPTAIDRTVRTTAATDLAGAVVHPVAAGAV
jgi:hypothetical protein